MCAYTFIEIGIFRTIQSTLYPFNNAFFIIHDAILGVIYFQTVRIGTLRLKKNGTSLNIYIMNSFSVRLKQSTFNPGPVAPPRTDDFSLVGLQPSLALAN